MNRKVLSAIVLFGLAGLALAAASTRPVTTGNAAQPTASGSSVETTVETRTEYVRRKSGAGSAGAAPASARSGGSYQVAGQANTAPSQRSQQQSSSKRHADRSDSDDDDNESEDDDSSASAPTTAPNPAPAPARPHDDDDDHGEDAEDDHDSSEQGEDHGEDDDD